MPSAPGKGKRREKSEKRGNPFAKARSETINTDREIRNARRKRYTRRNNPY